MYSISVGSVRLTMHGHVEVKGNIGGKEGVRFRGMERKGAHLVMT
jgi:hypothetical protein